MLHYIQGEIGGAKTPVKLQLSLLKKKKKNRYLDYQIKDDH